MRRDLWQGTPQGPTGTWYQDDGGNGGRTDVGMAADADMWLREQRRAAEAGGWRVWSPSRWTMLRSKRGGGERVWKRSVIKKRGCIGG